MMNSLYDRLKINGASEHTLKNFLNSGKVTSNWKPSRKDKKNARKQARFQMMASQSITEVGATTAIVYPKTTTLSEVKNGNKIKANQKTVYIPIISGAKWDFPIAFISKDIHDSKNQDNKQR